MDSDKSIDTGGTNEDLDNSIESDGNHTEASRKSAPRTVEVDYENMMKLVEYADEMAKHIWHFCSIVPDDENEESLLLLYSYQNFRGSADADHGERKAPTLQEMPESKSSEQGNSEVPIYT